MRPFLIGAGLSAALAVGMLAVLANGSVTQVERYSSRAVHVGAQEGGHVIVD